MLNTFKRIVMFVVPLATAVVPAPAADGPPSPADEVLLYAEDFDRDLSRWIVEQRPGGRVFLDDGKLVIEDAGGCSVWFRTRLQAPVVITFEATATSAARISDLNCFWMATDPESPDDLFYPGRPRDGGFGTYNTLRTYYVGYGGNNNTTTRFRRYDGTGARPLDPAHEKLDPAHLLIPDHTYHIELVADGGHVQYRRDGEVVFDFTDPDPLCSGWFAFRTVRSRLVIDNFRVWRKTGPGN